MEFVARLRSIAQRRTDFMGAEEGGIDFDKPLCHPGVVASLVKPLALPPNPSSSRGKGKFDEFTNRVILA